MGLIGLDGLVRDSTVDMARVRRDSTESDRRTIGQSTQLQSLGRGCGETSQCQRDLRCESHGAQGKAEKRGQVSSCADE